MINKLLIANRGEIACRVIKTARRLGIQTVAVYSDADQHALHVRMADEAVHIGAAPSSESYLIGDRIIKAALDTGAQAIHPGYGFLSENAEFAKACSDNNLIFVGPPSSSIEAMGSKSAAKSIMEKADVPLVPGYHGADQSPEILKSSADSMGYPVLLKAVAGGGGKGMRQVWSEGEFKQALEDAKRESIASFGNGDMLVEKYLTQPRHVEVQVFCDQHGNGVYLFERDCSVQRRHQKVIEEAPAPNISEQLRQQMGTTAVRAAQAIDYEGAGTVEFLLDSDGSFYFMEMNTRLQVEHPVTEMITGEDLVEWQIKVACGETLPKTQDQLGIKGHSLEARVYAEDPNNEFLPTTGTLNTLKTPLENDNVRVDTGVVAGDSVSPFYDPMIAKLIVWGDDREAALRLLRKSLREYQIQGVATNIDFLFDIANHPAFINADLETGFIENHKQDLFAKKSNNHEAALIKAALYLNRKHLNIKHLNRKHLNRKHQQQHSNQDSDPWSCGDYWRMNQANRATHEFEIADNQYTVIVDSHGDRFDVYLGEQCHAVTAELNGDQLTTIIDGHRTSATVTEDDHTLTIFDQSGVVVLSVLQPDLGEELGAVGANTFVAPMNGTVIEILVQAGEAVKAGQAVIIMEAMKMQHTMSAPSDGTIETLFCNKGELVDGGTTLLDFVAESTEG